MRGCLTCRQRHLKCDKTKPECLKCQKSSRQCVFPMGTRQAVIFRHGQNPSREIDGQIKYGERDQKFSGDQIWVEVPVNVTFEDETQRVASEYEQVFTDRRLSDQSFFPRVITPISSNMSETPTTNSPSVRGTILVAREVLPFNRDHSIASPLSTASGSKSEPLYNRVALGEPKLTNMNEARLLRHFENVLGPWLDVCNHERHFSVGVVAKAASCPLLLYACLAMSSLHLAHTTNNESQETPEIYHERCIRLLIPMIDDAIVYENIDILLASTVILRLFEQMSSHAPINDLQRHLLGGSAFVSTQPNCAVAGGLTEASFWVFVMQDIQFSLAYQIPLRMTFEPFNDRLQKRWREDPHPTESSWTHQAIWLLAETIRYCYSDAEIKNSAEGEILKTKVDAWEKDRPKSFDPLFFEGPDISAGRPWATVWHSHPWHVTAIQHICMARILLITCDPSRLRMGVGSGRHLRRLQEQVAGYAAVLFGVAQSNSDAVARFSACHALCACGPWIWDRKMQSSLLEMLLRTEKENGWPWTYIVEELREDWGWEFEDNPSPLGTTGTGVLAVSSSSAGRTGVRNLIE